MHCLLIKNNHVGVFPCRFEHLIFKFEVLDHKARERAGIIAPTLGSPIPVLLQLDVAVEVKVHCTLWVHNPASRMFFFVNFFGVPSRFIKFPSNYVS